MKLLTIGLLGNCIGGVCPNEGAPVVVPAVDKGTESSVEACDRAEVAAVEGLAFDYPNQTSTRVSPDPDVALKCM